MVVPHSRAGAHALLTRSPLPQGRSQRTVRLACVRHAASVRSEPGSNSQVDHAHRPSSSRRTPTGTLGASRSSLHVVLTCQQDTQARTTLSLDNDAARASLPFYQLFQQQSHSGAAGLSSRRASNLWIGGALVKRSEEHTSELQSLMR